MIKKIYNKLKLKYWKFIHYHYPYFWAKRLYKIELNKQLNIISPYDINEKILWLEFFTDTRKWSLYADKFAVREYVEKKVGKEFLIPLLGKWDNTENIRFESLPNSFVIKPNNGSYDTIIVHDKQKINDSEIRKQLALSLSKKFGFENAEPHYLRIKPCIIAEKLLIPNDSQGLIDYKVWCFNGKPYCILVCIGRDPITRHANLMYYDLQWNRHPEFISEPFKNDSDCKKPNNLDELLHTASKLSEGLPQCRVDLYIVDEKIYFGEITLTSNYGMMPYFTQEVLNDMGRSCKLPKRTFTDYYYSFINRYFPKL